MKERKTYLDYLRILATLCVIVIHVSAQRFFSLNPSESNWMILNFFNGIVRIAVPLFVMISGSLFLNNNVSIGVLYKKYILRLVVAYLVWSLAYAIIQGGAVKDIVQNTLVGHYHMWYIPMIVALYMCLPIIKKIVENEKIAWYFLILSGIINFIFPTIQCIMTDFGKGYLLKIFTVVSGNVFYMYAYLVKGYVPYFILGYLLDKIEIRKCTRIGLYFLGTIAAFTGIYLNRISSVIAGEPLERYFDVFSVNVLLESIAVFILFKSLREARDGERKQLQFFSKCCFGIYLVHPMVLEVFEKKIWGLVDSVGMIGYLLLTIIAVFLLSLLISIVLNLIPLMKKYVV